MKAKRKPIFWICISLILCLVSMIFSSAIQSDFGNVQVSKLKLVDREGYKISTQLYKPVTATKEQKAPCIITVEGWYNNKEMQDLYSVEYARRGYVVIATDMHGHGDSDSTDAKDLYSAGVGVDAAVELAGSLPYVDTNKIAVTGHSSGGAACDMAMALDNERKTPLISAVFFEASTWVDDTGADHSGDFRNRSSGIIADKYDEFFFWTKDDSGKDTVPRQFLTTPDARNYVNFNRGSEGVSDVEAGKFYTNENTDGTAYRVIYQPTCTHPWVHFSGTSVGYGINFFQKVFGAPNPISESNQIWQLKTFFNFIGLVGIVIFTLAFMLRMLETPYFGCLKSNEIVEPVKVNNTTGKRWFWITLVLGALFSGFSYFWTIQNIYSKTTPFFVQTGPLTIGVWCVLSGLFCLILMIICKNAYFKKIGFSPADRGIKISIKNLWKTIILAVLTTGLAFLILFFANYFFTTDFRLWVLTLKAFEADKIGYALRYLPMFLWFYIINSISINCFNYNNIGGKCNISILSIFNILGAVGFVLIQYITFFTTGALKWYSTEGFRISGIWLYPAIVYLFVTPYLTRFIYKRTKNPYLCAIVSAIIITIMAVANTTTVLGGGAVVASNY